MQKLTDNYPIPRPLASLHRTPLQAVVLCALFALLILGGGCAGGNGYADIYSKSYTAAQINANPAILNNTVVKGSDLSGLRLQNVVIKNATLMNTTATGVLLRNVIFDNCRLINASFDRSTLDNVTFLGGIITCENDAYNIKRRTQFTNSQFMNLIIDGTYLENSLFDGSNSSVTIRNVHQAIAVHPIVTGMNIRLALHNSLFRHMTVAEVVGASTLTASNCTFEYAFFGNSTFTRTDLFKNITVGGAAFLGSPKKNIPNRR